MSSHSFMSAGNKKHEAVGKCLQLMSGGLTGILKRFGSVVLELSIIVHDLNHQTVLRLKKISFEC